MDVLLENVPHLVPRKEMLEDWFKPDEQQLGLWKELYGGDQVDFSMACNAFAHRLPVLSALDNISTSLNAALLPMFEGQMVDFPLRFANHSETKASARRLLSLTKTLNQWSAQAETHEELLVQYERSTISPTEVQEQQMWPRFLVNRANMNASHGGRTGEQYLETRKIFLPQGAALILHQWHDELDEFVDEIEMISVEPSRVLPQKASVFQLYNRPLKVRSGVGMYCVTKYTMPPLPFIQGGTSSMQRESIPALAAFLSCLLDEGVDSPDVWCYTNVCFTSVLTAEEIQRSRNAILWRPSKL